MTPIIDINGHLVCYVDWQTGQMENVYNKQHMIAHLPIGSEIVIRRRGTRTLVRRLPDGKFYTYSMIDPEPLESHRTQ